jgi:dephospho-CoA kinase
MQRENVSEEIVRQRMNNQMDEAEKMKRCDFVVINDEEQMLLPQVLALHKKFISQALKIHG